MKTIIDAWRELTTCKDCTKCYVLETIFDLERLACNARVTSKIMPVRSDGRCDSGLWLFKGKSPGVIGGPYEIPFDLKDWLELQVGINPDSYTLIFREDWPEAPHE